MHFIKVYENIYMFSTFVQREVIFVTSCLHEFSGNGSGLQRKNFRLKIKYFL